MLCPLRLLLQYMHYGCEINSRILRMLCVGGQTALRWRHPLSLPVKKCGTTIWPSLLLLCLTVSRIPIRRMYNKWPGQYRMTLRDCKSVWFATRALDRRAQVHFFDSRTFC